MESQRANKVGATKLTVNFLSLPTFQTSCFSIDFHPPIPSTKKKDHQNSGVIANLNHAPFGKTPPKTHAPNSKPPFCGEKKPFVFVGWYHTFFSLDKRLPPPKRLPKNPSPKNQKKTNECLADFFFEKKSAVFFLIFSFGGKNSKHFPWVGLGLSRSRRDWKSNAWDVAPGVFCSRVPRRHFPATKRRFFGSQLLSRYLRSPEPLGT